MTKVSQNSWLAGQLDAEMCGRQDMKFYRNGASEIVNFLPVKRGSIRKRPGTDYVADITSWIGTTSGGSTNKFRMFPFGYLSDSGYVLILCPNASPKAKVFKADGTSIDVTISNGVSFYNNSHLDTISYVQCGDIMFLAHKNRKPIEIRHDIVNGTETFTMSYITFNPVTSKPVVSEPTITRKYFEKFTFYQSTRDVLDSLKSKADFTDPSDRYAIKYNTIYGDSQISYGTTTITYAASILLDGSEGPLSDPQDLEFHLPFTETQVNSIPVTFSVPSGTKSWELRLYKDAGGVFGLIGTHKGTSTGSGKTHTFKDDNIAPDTSVTPIDTTDGTPFGSSGNYPGCVGLYQQRLVWAGSGNDPARIWMSQAGDFYEYRPHTKLQTDDAIDFILPITQFANLNFIIELGRLFVFSECTELVVGSSSDNQGVSYETIMASEHSHLGSRKRLPPIVANNTLLFVNRTGDSVRDYDMQISNSRYGGTDVSILSSSIFDDNPIVDWTWQQEPNSTVWCVLSDGSLASFTYVKEQEIAAWAVHRLGGGGKAICIAKSCAIFGNDSSRPSTGEVFVAVKRGTGANAVLTLERMRPWGTRDDTNGHKCCLDSVRPGEVTAGGRTYYQDCGCSGFPFESKMTTMPPVIGDEVGNAQFDVKLGQHAHLRLIDSYGGKICAVGMEGKKSEIGAEGDMDANVLLAGSNNRDGRVSVYHDGPMPFQMTLLELDYEAEEGT